MSQYELKHRLSTITTSAALSNGRRLKTTVGPQFNTIQENGYTNQKSKANQKSRHKLINIPLRDPKQSKQSRRYSQADWSIHPNHRSVNLRRQTGLAQINNKAGENRKSQQFANIKPNKIRIKSEYNSTHNKITIPYIQLTDQHKLKQELMSSEQYIEHLQREKNRRIQEIYNPQSIASNSKSISMLRKNKSKNVSINKFGTEELIQSLKKDKGKLQVENTIEHYESQHNSRQKQSNINNSKHLKQSVERIYPIIIDSGHSKGSKPSSAPKILPITFQRVQQLSTIQESTESTNNLTKAKKTQQYSYLTKQKSTRQSHHHSLQPGKQISTDNVSMSSKSKTPNSESLPFPKFNNFFDSYHADNESKSQNKTYLFHKMKNGEKYETPKSGRMLEESEIKNQKVKQLTIFDSVDKSLLRVIKMDEGVFYGEVDQNDLKNGKGAIFYHNGKIYEGEFKNDVKEGQGIEQFPDGSVYSGHFKNGKRNGKGRFEWPNGQSYDGQWQNNFKHGSGLWESRDSTASYIGEWCYGTISGFGVLTNQKGQRYEGQFHKFNKQGHGAYRWENGDRLVGNFKRNQPNGQCEYYWANGDYYKGYFSNGLRHGKGIIKYNDTSFFEGQFRNDKKCGLGREQYSDNVIYFGNYQNDLRHGYGKLIYNDEIYYEGYWLNNVAVIFKEQSNTPEQIIEDEKERLASGMSNNFSANKLKKLEEQDQQKIIKSMRSKVSPVKKSKIQRFSSKNLLQRLCQPKKRCRCLLKH